MKTLEDSAYIYCSQELTQVLDDQIICLSVINTILAFTAIVGNTLILIALRKDNSLHRPSKVLIRNLVVSDLLVGFAELLLVGQWISILQEHWKSCHYFYLAYIMGAFVLISVSLLTLTAISVDRLLALCLGLSYRQVVTIRRVYVVVIAVWVLSVGNAILVLLNLGATKVVQPVSTIMCLITAFFCYTRIFFRLHQQTQANNIAPEQKNHTIPLNISRYRKTVSTALWLQLALVLCYFPYMLLAPFALPEIAKKHSSVWYFPLYFAVTVMFFNSTLNPILYCWKIKEVRRTVKDMFPCY
ncbi:melanocyte-stimulating hormone receptor-like [Acropora millepora]|uniref:melanocyte-stimulating hormone receptor-like n=1 Tax=Acropora millepora TaxID=45264 RepID=UPI001CF5D962|nr:melanocyte-stimulating hormone receptor-like [Acropora millepora]